MKMKRKTSLTAILFFALLLGYSCSRDNTLSDEMMGIWKTSSFQYMDTYFKLKKNQIIFKTKTGDINVHPITKIKRQKIAKDEWVLYTIYYRNNEMQKVEFPFYYHTLDDGKILFKNQKNVVWRKEKQ
jgi:hypothetical protein